MHLCHRQSTLSHAVNLSIILLSIAHGPTIQLLSPCPPYAFGESHTWQPDHPDAPRQIFLPCHPPRHTVATPQPCQPLHWLGGLPSALSASAVARWPQISLPLRHSRLPLPDPFGRLAGRPTWTPAPL
ncbi:hypothetical protein F4780DRAFT_19312 [Xylariomycetidae sp. FL0641]|nr:hypothetical protein F4780DRAFT_19312 [Xylariomycetidae sp. FL0641]